MSIFGIQVDDHDPTPPAAGHQPGPTPQSLPRARMQMMAELSGGITTMPVGR